MAACDNPHQSLTNVTSRYLVQGLGDGGHVGKEVSKGLLCLGRGFCALWQQLTLLRNTS